MRRSAPLRRSKPLRARKQLRAKRWPHHVEIGGVFGRLTVMAEGPRAGSNRERAWICRCRCGTERPVRGSSLRSGETKSCGCASVDTNRIRLTTHGLHGTPEYRSWIYMVKRCTNPRDKDWPNYGGRGISVCERWRASFKSFIQDMGPQPLGRRSIDRINNDGNYEPGNCRWATAKEQANNRRAPRRGHLRRKRPRRLSRPGSNPALLAFVRSLPCAAVGLPGHRCRGPIEANHDTQHRGVGQKAPDDRAFPLASGCHRDWHDGRGPFKGWKREARRAWADACIAAVQALSVPGDDARHAVALESLGLGRMVDGAWVPGLAVTP